MVSAAWAIRCKMDNELNSARIRFQLNEWSKKQAIGRARF